MKKILVVDDDRDILYLVCHILILNGFDVKAYPTGTDVPDVVIDYNPDLVLLDILLPGKLGTEVCKELKKKYTNLPIILFSAHAEPGEELSLFGADAFIRKTF